MEILYLIVETLIGIILAALAAYMLGRLITMGAMRSIHEARILWRKQRGGLNSKE
jgi:uncharacterized membrane protein YdjX (TVP38/TMEM64 family)